MKDIEFIEGIFIKELKNRFLCEIKINDRLFECHVPFSYRLANFLELEGKPVLVKSNITPNVRTRYALVAMPYKRSYLLLNSSFANRVIEENIHRRRFSFLRKRKTILKEHHVEGYKADLFINDSSTIVEVKGVISTSRTAIFPKIHSERANRQLKALSELLQKGYKVCYIIVSLNPYVNEIVLDMNSTLFELFTECQALGMQAKGFAIKLKENKIVINKEIPLINIGIKDYD